MIALKRMVALCAIVLLAIAACSSVSRYASPPQAAEGQASPSASATPAYTYQH